MAPPSLLIVDDNSSIRSILRVYLIGLKAGVLDADTEVARARMQEVGANDLIYKPVTAETLESSQTKLANVAELVSGNGWAALAHLTLGRFVTAAFFVLVLLVTCVALGYQSTAA